ncbi:MAG TPA: alpha-amylase family glycosyl hydrolase [Candidatus Nanopelagicaceae bacterium]|nr:alpha-amylase family glycosyl hydrolase [Candidatus Nanopelagicaceae bacterium]
MNQQIVAASSSDDLDWFRRGAIYQIFPDRFARRGLDADRELAKWGTPPTRENFFGGNLSGISEQIPYLKKLGISTLYLTPIFKSPSNHRYDTEDYFQIDPLLGNKNDLEQLVANAERKQISVVLDGVFNHVGETFPDFVKAKAGEKLSRELFYFLDDTTRYQTCGGASFLPKLNHQNPEILDLVARVMEYWDPVGIRGWRLDVPWKVPQAFWDQLRIRTQHLTSNRLWMAEAWNQWSFADPFDSLTNYHARTRLIDFAHRHDADAEDLLFDLEQWASLRADPSLIVNVVGSHDTARLMTACDSIRTDSLMVLALNALLPGVPCVYYGDELGLEGNNDPDCRRTMPTELNASQRDYLEAVRSILQMRSVHLGLSHGDLTVEAMRNRAFVLSRTYDDCTIRIAANAGDKAEEFSIPQGDSWLRVTGQPISRERYLQLSPKSLAVQIQNDCRCG